ncbi:hypothetical protein SAOR_15240 [Salinisphaera orenii MK-B5]|uniref:Uncharacterized protein n=1 Tax=Salinisphaera orenii MK-B5 TaxID=856730 RepID=A0A423PG54_9GAMM|nr:hypothetical protein SAOR_15240 [Salinisphaera orenii MK-B5]
MITIPSRHSTAASQSHDPETAPHPATMTMRTPATASDRMLRSPHTGGDPALMDSYGAA